MLGTFVNATAVILGSSIGLLIKNHLPERFSKLFFQVVGLFTICIGVSMVADMQNMLTVIISLILGTICGEFLEIENNINQFGDWIKKRLKTKDDRFSEGLSTAFLLFSIGAMSILGAIEEGSGQYPELLLTKSVLDGVSAIILASALGVGVLVSSIFVLIFQGSISLLTMFLGNFFTPDILNGISTVGGVLLLGLGLKILEIKKFSILNMLPSIIFVVIGLWLKSHLL